ncbi:hypothetical protein AB0O22_08465 [Streptomyces sp. NPDC091204]|uniref:hypothetical protein n=1 Tax=Streptomyces sp. NPDC091204 TaxID=3155299 RepID=UPI0034214444
MRWLLRIPAALALALTVGVLWWWAVLRLVLAPEESGAVEGAVAVGGWGLGLLPVHCVPGPVRKARRSARAGVRGGAAGGSDGSEGGAGASCSDVAGAGGAGSTRASTLRRSGEGSDPS